MLCLCRAADARQSLGSDRPEPERRLRLANRQLPEAWIPLLGGGMELFQPQRVDRARLCVCGVRNQEGGGGHENEDAKAHGRSAARMNSGRSALRCSIMATNVASSWPRIATSSGRSANGSTTIETRL